MSDIEINKQAVRIAFNGVATLAAIIGGLFGLFGYYLYTLGVAPNTEAHVKTTSKFLGFEVTGRGPGIFFIVLGAAVVIFAVVFATAARTEGANRSSRPARRRNGK